MSEWISEWEMKERINEQMNEWVHEWMNKWVNLYSSTSVLSLRLYFFLSSVFNTFVRAGAFRIRILSQSCFHQKPPKNSATYIAI